MALTFNYVKENPNNEVMEKILDNLGFAVAEVDDEGTAYTQRFGASTLLDDFFEDYTDIDSTRIITYEFRPFLAYGFGFRDDVLVIIYGINGEELDEFFMDIDDFIDMFDR